jgi:hypothetical protein
LGGHRGLLPWRAGWLQGLWTEWDG